MAYQNLSKFYHYCFVFTITLILLNYLLKESFINQNVMTHPHLQFIICETLAPTSVPTRDINTITELVY